MKKFSFKPAQLQQRSLVHQWLKTLHAAEWFYGQGLENTLKHLDEFFEGKAFSSYWIGYEGDHPFAFFIASSVVKPEDPLTKWCAQKGKAITLDMLIGDPNYLGKGLASGLIHAFLKTQFADVTEVLIDPEASNTRAVHVYQKAGFVKLGEFIPSHHIDARTPRPLGRGGSATLLWISNVSNATAGNKPL